MLYQAAVDEEVYRCIMHLIYIAQFDLCGQNCTADYSREWTQMVKSSKQNAVFALR